MYALFHGTIGPFFSHIILYERTYVCTLYCVCVWVFVCIYVGFDANVVYIYIFLLNFHLYGISLFIALQCYACHAANTHLLIHMNVWTSTAITNEEKKSQTHFLTQYQPNNQPTNSMSLNIVKFYTIITAPDWQIGAHFIKGRGKKRSVPTTSGKYKKPLCEFVFTFVCFENAITSYMCVNQTIVNHFWSAWKEDQYITNWHILNQLTHACTWSINWINSK